MPSDDDQEMRSIVVENVTPDARDQLLETIYEVGDDQFTVRTDMVLFVPEEYDEQQLADDLRDHVQEKVDSEGDEISPETAMKASQANDIIKRLRDRDGAFGGEHAPPRGDIQ